MALSAARWQKARQHRGRYLQSLESTALTRKRPCIQMTMKQRINPTVPRRPSLPPSTARRTNDHLPNPPLQLPTRSCQSPKHAFPRKRTPHSANSSTRWTIMHLLFAALKMSCDAKLTSSCRFQTPSRTTTLLLPGFHPHHRPLSTWLASSRLRRRNSSQTSRQTHISTHASAHRTRHQTLRLRPLVLLQAVWSAPAPQ